MDALTDQFIIYIALIGVIALVGMFNKSIFPTSLLLVIVGMLISLIPNFPHIRVHSSLVLNIFLPILLYQAGAYASWRDFKKNFRPIAYLSIGHVIFITVLVAVTIHYLIPQLSWPLAFVLGAVISPPDDVAIIAIAEKIHFPRRIITILTGEGLLNDATALILFRFALVAVVTHVFYPVYALISFFGIIVGETLYGFALGHLMGQIRLRVKDPILQITISFVIPFLAFLVPEKLGGSGVIATVVTGIVIGTLYMQRFPPEVRITALAVWSTLGFILQSLLFILVGLEMRYIMTSISAIPVAKLCLYSFSIIFVVIAGRFIWVFAAAHFSRGLFRQRNNKDPVPPWQALVITSWAGMRGGISLAAALAVPTLPAVMNGVDPRDLLVFLVFSVIAFTLLFQGMSLSWLIHKLGLAEHGKREQYAAHVDELQARSEITHAVLKWLSEYKVIISKNSKESETVRLRIQEYENQQKHLHKLLKEHDDDSIEHEILDEFKSHIDLSLKIIGVERTVIARLWEENRIEHEIRNKLTQQLDHRERHVTGYA